MIGMPYVGSRSAMKLSGKKLERVRMPHFTGLKFPVFHRNTDKKVWML